MLAYKMGRKENKGSWSRQMIHTLFLPPNLSKNLPYKIPQMGM